MTHCDRGALEDGLPPGFERCINRNIEGGFGRGSCSKGIGGVGAVCLVVVESIDSPESACASLIECGSVGVCEGDGATS